MLSSADLSRFLSKIQTGATLFDCWEWKGNRTTDGYGRFGHDDRYSKAHRLAYEYFVGVIPDGLQIDHLCRNKGCVNPAHLDVVTGQENIIRMKLFLHPSCRKGHPYTPENTGSAWKGPEKTQKWRRCKTCQRDYARRRRHAQPRRTYCPQGHFLCESNLIVSSNGSRYCKTCILNKKRDSRGYYLPNPK